MVRAILDGRKTQTRRLIKPHDVAAIRFCEGEPPGRSAQIEFLQEGHSGAGWYVHDQEYPDEGSHFMRCPYGEPGDRLWVRETFLVDGPDPVPLTRPPISMHDILYRADGPSGIQLEDHAEARWRPSIHMPRWASRITLEIESIRVEHLCDISDADAEAEGCERPAMDIAAGFMREVFHGVWDHINGKRAPWKANPHVWVITFKVVES